jgi:hypothetical protein
MNMVQDPTHIYLDVNVCNNAITNTNTNPQQIIFNSKRDIDYITDASKYFVSVARFSLDCRLPVCIPQIDLTYNDGMFDPLINGYRTIYSFTLQVNKGDVVCIGEQTYVNFRPQHLNVSHPIAPITSMQQVYDNRYFYIESVQYMLKLVNEALFLAWGNVIEEWANLQLVNPAIGNFPLTNNIYPFFSYNYDGNFTLNVEPKFYTNILPNAGQGFMYMNGPLYTLFNGLSSFIIGYDSTSIIDSSNGKNHQILFSDDTLTTTYNNLDYLYVLTEYPCVPFWSPVSSIVFTTQGIPVSPTNVAPTNVTGSSVNLASTNNNNGLSPIITDFDINYVTGLEGRSILYYAPQGEYRFFDLNSNRPLSDINIVVYWKDKLTGTTHPMYISSGGSATMKLLFRNKNFFKGGN